MKVGDLLFYGPSCLLQCIYLQHRSHVLQQWFGTITMHRMNYHVNVSQISKNNQEAQMSQRNLQTLHGIL